VSAMATLRGRAALVEGGHGGAPVAGGLSAVFFGEGNWTSFSASAKGIGCDFGADGRSGAEGRRRAGVVGVAGVWREWRLRAAAPSRVSVLG